MNVKKREGEGAAAYMARCMLMASGSAMWAEVCTIPMDTAKVRLQIQKVAEGEKPRYSGLMGTC